MLSAWLCIIRVKFLLASVMAVLAGLAIHWWQNSFIDAAAAALTMGGVVALHASVDLLNDYWDHRRGIDANTRRTPMSGGTGVLPRGLLEPRQVYRAGIGFLVLGSLIGTYFVITGGVVIAAILGFAVLSIYFYSTKIVNYGLAELFVATKGTMIVLGTAYIQGAELTAAAALAGAVMGVLSALVLFVTSFPDRAADKAGGRRTLVTILGSARAASLFWAFPSCAFVLLASGVALGLFPVLVLLSLLAAPLFARAGVRLQRHHAETGPLVPAMSDALLSSRAAGALLVLGLVMSGVLGAYT